MNIRKATHDDAQFLFNLRNEPEVRAASWNSDLVEFINHQKWLISTLSDSNRILYILEEGNAPIGQVRYDTEDKKAEVSVSISANFAGRGYASQGLRESAKLFFVERPEVQKIIAHIKPNNTASVKCFANAGFVNCGEMHYEGHKCVKMELCVCCI